MKTCDIFNFKVFSDSLVDLRVENNYVINTINAYSYVIAKKDDHFREALKSSDILLPDGFPIAFAAWMLRGIKIDKIAGEDVFFHLLNLMNHSTGKVFFLGASKPTLFKITSRIQKEFPGISVGSYSPPYKKVFTKEDSEEMIKEINLFCPDVLFVGMTAPKQEKWVHQHKDQINANVVCSIGAVFDFYAETIKRPSKFWINVKLEWFIRFLIEPRRLWKRYLIFSPRFFFDVFKEKFRKQRD